MHKTENKLIEAKNRTKLKGTISNLAAIGQIFYPVLSCLFLILGVCYTL
jgi:hypothetical protein